MTVIKSDTQITLSKLPENSSIKRHLQEIRDFNHDFDCKEDDPPDTLSAEDLLGRLLVWNGIIGYSHIIMGWIEEMQGAKAKAKAKDS